MWSTDTLTVSTIGDTTIEWNSFDLAATEHLYFNQVTYSNWVQNNVLGTAPVQISGTISSNGGVGVSAETIALNGSIAAHSVALGMGDSRPMPLPSAIRTPIAVGGDVTLQPSNGAVVLVVSRDQVDLSTFQSSNVGGFNGGSVLIGGSIRLVNGNGLQLAGGILDPSREPITLVSSVPEPETYAMFLAGLAWMGVVTRRRKQRNA